MSARRATLPMRRSARPRTRRGRWRIASTGRRLMSVRPLLWRSRRPRTPQLWRRALACAQPPTVRSASSWPRRSRTAASGSRLTRRSSSATGPLRTRSVRATSAPAPTLTARTQSGTRPWAGSVSASSLSTATRRATSRSAASSTAPWAAVRGPRAPTPT